MEVRARQLSRDRLAFSKSILKRYLRDSLSRDSNIAAPWFVKPRLAAAFGISNALSADDEERHRRIRDGQLAKRRKVRHCHPLSSASFVSTSLIITRVRRTARGGRYAAGQEEGEAL